MKFSKSGILAMSCMLLVNSFLLVATAYATNNNKGILIDPSHAKQDIEEIILSDGSTRKLCSVVLFDKSGSMRNGQGGVEKKRDDAVAGAIKYSEIILGQDPNAEIGLVLFSSSATIAVPLGKELFTGTNFSNDNGTTNYYQAIIKAEDMLTGHDECKIKNIILMSDGEPNGPSYDNEVTKVKNDGIMLYSIGYHINNNGKSILGGISAGGFYEAKSRETLEQIFKNLANRDNKETSIKMNNSKFKIKTYNVIFTMSGTQNTQNIIEKSYYSNILGGKGNNISANSNDCTIIAGNENIIHTSINSTILGGKENKIKNSKDTTIGGGNENEVEYGNYTTIGGGNGNEIKDSSYSTIIGNNSKIISGDSSVAMGSGTVISNGKNSFYWNDGSSDKELGKNNVFAVVSRNGVAFNTNNPNENAQLTISGNLIVKPNETNDTNIQCGDGIGKGILKAVNKGSSKECFCSCNGEKRVSLYNGECEGLCNNEIKPVCGNSVTFIDSNKTYSGSCNTGTVIDTSYFVNSGNIIHRICQGHDGSTTNCTGTLP